MARTVRLPTGSFFYESASRNKRNGESQKRRSTAALHDLAEFIRGICIYCAAASWSAAVLRRFESLLWLEFFYKGLKATVLVLCGLQTGLGEFTPDVKNALSNALAQIVSFPPESPRFGAREIRRDRFTPGAHAVR